MQMSRRINWRTLYCTWALFGTQHTLLAASGEASDALDGQEPDDVQGISRASRSADFVHPDVTLTKIAFGSCHKNAKTAVPSIWDAVRREDVDAWLWTGDSVYPPKKNRTGHTVVGDNEGKKTVQNRWRSWADRYGPAPLEDLERQFREMHTNDTIGYNQFHPPHGVYGVWDDHDFGGNDMGKEMPQKEQRRQLYWKKMLRLKPPTRLAHLEQKRRDNADHDSSSSENKATEERQGVYHSIEWGGLDAAPDDSRIVKAILLDTRSFRDEYCIPGVAHRMPLGNALACTTRWAVAGLDLRRTIPTVKNWLRKFRRDDRDSIDHEPYPDDCAFARMLGDQQWAWLEHQLQDTKANVIVIVSSVQVLTTNPVMESWGHFPEEQRRLVNLIARTQETGGAGNHAPTIVLLSGDVHHAEFLGYADPIEAVDPSSAAAQDLTMLGQIVTNTQHGTRLVEVTSSGMTHDCSQPKLIGKLCEPLLQNFDAHRQIGTSNHSVDANRRNYYIGRNYGVLSIDWEARQISIDVKTQTGDVAMSMSLPMNRFKISRNIALFDRTPDVWEHLPHTWDGHLVPLFEKLSYTALAGVAVLGALAFRTVKTR